MDEPVLTIFYAEIVFDNLIYCSDILKEMGVEFSIKSVLDYMTLLLIKCTHLQRKVIERKIGYSLQEECEYDLFHEEPHVIDNK